MTVPGAGGGYFHKYLATIDGDWANTVCDNCYADLHPGITVTVRFFSACSAGMKEPFAVIRERPAATTATGARRARFRPRARCAICASRCISAVRVANSACEIKGCIVILLCRAATPARAPSTIPVRPPRRHREKYLSWAGSPRPPLRTLAEAVTNPLRDAWRSN